MAQVIPLFQELPEPERRPSSPEAKQRRRRRFAVVLNAFVLAYSAAHKLAIPVFVTHFSRTQASQPIDWWWTYHLLLAALLRRRSWDDAALRLCVIAGLGGTTCQIVASFSEKSWHSVSLWVTSGAALALLSYLLSISKWRAPLTYRVPRYLAALAAGALFQFAFFGFTLAHPGLRPTTVLAAESRAEYAPLRDPDACGSKGFSLQADGSGPLALPQTAEVSDVPVLPCGFFKTLARFDRDKPLTVRNDTASYLNVKAYRLSDGRWVGFENMPLPPGARHVLAAERLGSARK